MASLAGETASVEDTAAESDVPSRLCDSIGHNGMHPTHTQIAVYSSVSK